MKNAILFLLLCNGLIAQKSKDSIYVINDDAVLDSIVQVNAKGSFHSIETQFHTGAHIYGGESLKKDLGQFFSTTVKFGWQDSKPDSWARKYGSPIYGLGIYAGNIGDKEVFGQPRAAYAYITFQTSKYWRKNVFQITPHLGLTYHLEKYDPVRNPDNDAISSTVSLYFDMEFSFAYQLNRELELVYGIDFMHSSNGRLFTPNFGLNMLGIDVALRYNYNRSQRFLDKNVYTTNVVPARYHRIPKVKNDILKQSSIATYFAFGNVQNYADEDHATDVKKRYWTNSIALDYVYQYNTMISFTGGLDFFYDRSLVTTYPDSKDWALYGIHAGSDFNFWNFAIRFQLGTYLGSDRSKDNIWMRPAFLYKFNKWLILQCGLKTRRGAGADWIEWGVAFVPFRWGGAKK